MKQVDVLIPERIREMVADLESALISASDLLYQIDIGTLAVENDDYKRVLRDLKKNLSDIIQKVAYNNENTL